MSDLGNLSARRLQLATFTSEPGQSEVPGSVSFSSPWYYLWVPRCVIIPEVLRYVAMVDSDKQVVIAGKRISK